MSNTTNLHCYTILCFFTSITLIPIFAIASNSITATKPLTIHQTIVSAGEDFELGFFNSSNTNWYVGIWYKKLPTKTIVWVANRDNPLTSPSGVLKIGENGRQLFCFVSGERKTAGAFNGEREREEGGRRKEALSNFEKWVILFVLCNKVKKGRRWPQPHQLCLVWPAWLYV